MPNGVHSVCVMAVGGEAGDGSGGGSGGGSGYVAVSDVNVNTFDAIPVTVGLGSAASSYKYNDGAQTATARQASLFGSLVRANGGPAPGSNGGSGGSGCGGSFQGGTSGAGGINGAAVGNSNSNRGIGQGAFSSVFTIFQLFTFTAGIGGSGAHVNDIYCGGGGGGGGVLMNGNGPVVEMAGVGMQEREALERALLAGAGTATIGMQEEMELMDLSMSNGKSNGHCVNTVL